MYSAPYGYPSATAGGPGGPNFGNGAQQHQQHQQMYHAQQYPMGGAQSGGYPVGANHAMMNGAPVPPMAASGHRKAPQL
jgi:hypothetical protein